ncbi:uncharacterized protein LOC143559972 [Bidens hawaiensis]|uniref:uncharacterized protein LOC143559972 n=1 Tax=Bidens hawaiensis TaxID=980011 RepID=UPI00404B2C7C
MQQRRWLELVKDYDLEFMYHHGKANVVADTMNRKGRPKIISVKSYLLILKPDILQQIDNVQSEALQVEWIISEHMRGQEKLLEVIGDGVKYNDCRLDRKKSYANKRGRPIVFEAGDRVMLKVSPWKGIIRFHKRGKLSPRFLGPFRILSRDGEVDYRLDLPDELAGIHPTFHVSYLRKCLADKKARVPLGVIEIDSKLSYIEESIAILDRQERRLRNEVVCQVKVQWENREGSEATWEPEDDLMTLYKQQFLSWPDSGMNPIANVVADALNRKERPKTISMKSYLLILKPDILQQIANIQSEALQVEWIMSEHMWGQEKLLEVIGDGAKYNDCQSERAIKSLDDILRACVIDFCGSWDYHLPLVEFSYTNNYHATIGIPLFEMLYGRRCRTSVAQDRQKSYANKRGRPIVFEAGDRVMLKFSPWKGIISFHKRGKLSPRFLSSFRILSRDGEVAYRLDLPDELAGIHPNFHVSHLRKCLADKKARVPLGVIELDSKLSYIEESIAILDRQERRLRNEVVSHVKVQWGHREGSEATWEPEDDMMELYKQQFLSNSEEFLRHMNA